MPKWDGYLSAENLKLTFTRAYTYMKYLLTGEETERLKFRLVEPSDFDVWMGLFKTKNIAKFLDLDSKLSELELCNKWFDKAFHRYENDLGGMNALIDKKTDQLIGQCGLLIQTIENIVRLEIGYSILPQFCGKGYASEAAIKCRDFAFEHSFVNSIFSMIHLENIGSEKVALRNGMSFEKKVDAFNIFRIDKENWRPQK